MPATRADLLRFGLGYFGTDREALRRAAEALRRARFSIRLHSLLWPKPAR